MGSSRVSSMSENFVTTADCLLIQLYNVLRLIQSISAILVLVNPMEIGYFTSAKSSSTLGLPAALVLLESGCSAIFTKNMF